MGIGWQQILVILIIVLLLFGRGKIASVMKEFGQGMRGFKQGLKGDEDKQEAPKIDAKEDDAAN